MKLNEFDYNLAQELIAQTPIEPRDHSRLLVVDPQKESLEDKIFYEILDEL
jgi:S-adenosylmethionine:tRNA ribosyltransferase-isomerase